MNNLAILATADADGRVTPSTLRQDARSRVLQPKDSPTPILAFADAAGRVYAEWGESKHPRDPEGEDGGQFISTGSRVPAFIGTREDALSKFKTNGVPGPVFLTTSLTAARAKAEDALLYHGGGRAAVLEVRVPVGEVLKAKPEGVWPGRGFSFVRDAGVPAAWISKITETPIQAFADVEEATLFYLPVVLKDKQPKQYAISRPLYVSRHVENADEIITWAKSVGFDTTLPAEDMHVTVCYSKEPVDWLQLDHDDVTLEIPPEGVRTLAWDEGKHPRAPAGSEDGGQFVPEEYHGTVGRVAKSILKRGILPGSGESVVWAASWKERALEYSLEKTRQLGLDKGLSQEAIGKLTSALVVFRPSGEIIGQGINIVPGGVPAKDIVRIEFYSVHTLETTKLGEVPKPIAVVHRHGQYGEGLAYAVVPPAMLLSVDEEGNYADRTLTHLGEDGAMVLQFDSAPLAARHQYFLDHGASWDYDGYHPHITLTYAAPAGLDLSTIEPYTGRIVLGSEEFQELETGWAGDIKENAEEDGGDPRRLGPGVWRTIHGRRVYIRDGQTPELAIQESLSRESNYAKLRLILTGRIQDESQAKRDPDLAEIVKRGELFSTKNKEMVSMRDGLCHWNVAKLFTQGKVDTIVLGYAKNPYGWVQHTWGLKNGYVVETTPSNLGANKYFGMKLSAKEAKAFSTWTEKNRPGKGMVRTVEGGRLRDKP